MWVHFKKSKCYHSKNNSPICIFLQFFFYLKREKELDRLRKTRRMSSGVLAHFTFLKAVGPNPHLMNPRLMSATRSLNEKRHHWIQLTPSTAITKNNKSR